MNKYKTKIYFQIVALAIISLMTFSCQLIINGDSKDDHATNTKYFCEESFSYEINIANRDYINLEGINGTIEVNGVINSNTVKIWGERKVESDSKSDAFEHLEYLNIEIAENEDHIFVKTDQPEKNEGRNYIINYHLEVPVEWITSIGNVNGDIYLEDMNASMKINLVNGNVKTRNCEGDLDVDIVNGNYNGDICLPEEAICHITIVNGSISLGIPTNTSAQFSAGVVNGSISMQGLELKNIISTPVKMTGTLGNGTGNIDLDIVNGSINVTGF